MPTDRQALAALDDIDRILRERIGRPLASEGRMLDASELSAEYWEVRMRLDTALTLIDKIPVYGRRIATAVRFLMQICDRHCVPAPASGALPTDRALNGTHRSTKGGGRSDGAETAIYGHELHRPRSLRKEAAEHHRPSPPGGDRGLMGLL